MLSFSLCLQKRSAQSIPWTFPVFLLVQDGFSCLLIVTTFLLCPALYVAQGLLRNAPTMDTLVGIRVLTTYTSSTAAAFLIPGGPLDVYFHEPTMLLAAVLGGRCSTISFRLMPGWSAYLAISRPTGHCHCHAFVSLRKLKRAYLGVLRTACRMGNDTIIPMRFVSVTFCRYIETRARRRSRDTMLKLMHLQPTVAHVVHTAAGVCRAMSDLPGPIVHCRPVFLSGV